MRVRKIEILMNKERQKKTERERKKFNLKE